MADDSTPEQRERDERDLARSQELGAAWFHRWIAGGRLLTGTAGEWIASHIRCNEAEQHEWIWYPPFLAEVDEELDRYRGQTAGFALLHSFRREQRADSAIWFGLARKQAAEDREWLFLSGTMKYDGWRPFEVPGTEQRPVRTGWTKAPPPQ